MDLLDIAQNPDMQNNWQQMIAQLQPRMMPETTSPVAGGMYGADMGRQDQAIRQAMGLADLQARMKQRQASEYEMAAPGREARIGRGNMEAEDDIANMGQLLAKRRGDTEAAISANDVKMLKDEAKKLEEFVNAYDAADKEGNDPMKQQILAMMREKGAKFGKMDIGSLPPDRADLVMKALRRAQTNTSGNEQKDKALDVKKQIAEGNMAAMLTKAGMQQRTAMAVQAMRDKVSMDKRPAFDQMITAWVGKDPDRLVEALDAMISMKTYPATVRGDTAKPTPEITPEGITTVKPTITPAPSLRAPAPKPAAPKVDLKAEVEKAGRKYEPEKYNYRINPSTGKVQSKPK